MNSRDSVIRVLCNSESDSTIVSRTKNLVEIGRIIAPKEEQKPAVFILPTLVELYEQAMSLGTRNKIIVKSDTLSRNKLMRGDIRVIFQIYLKDLLKALFDGCQKERRT